MRVFGLLGYRVQLFKAGLIYPGAVSILIAHLIHSDVDSSILLLLNNLNLAAFKLSYKISDGNTFK